VIRANGNRLFTTHFEDFSYDISVLISRDEVSLNNIAFARTGELLFTPDAAAERTSPTLGEVAFEAHNRIAQALLCVIAALVGFATLLVGGFSRFGVWWQIVLAFTLLVGVKLVEGVISGPVLSNAALWPLLYLPTLCGMGLVIVLLNLSARPGAVRRWLWRVLPGRRAA